MPYIATDLDAFDDADAVAGSTGLPPPMVLGGLARTWRWCWRNKTDRVTAEQIAGFFCSLVPGLPSALVAFGFLRVDGDGFLVRTTGTIRDLPRGNDPDAPVVYFIGHGERGPIKIGYARNLRKRLHSLQTAHVGTLRVLAKIPATETGGRELEAVLHRRFAHLRLRGEWFSDGDDLLAYIEGLG